MIAIARRAAAACWRGNPDLVITTTEPIGFADAAEEDRARWLGAFRRLLDGLDAPLQVVIDVKPGSDDEDAPPGSSATGAAEMRAADLSFAERVRRWNSSHRVTTSMVTPERATARVQAALTEMGVRCAASAPQDLAFGRETATRFLHLRGFSRTWFIERLPGTELDRTWMAVPSAAARAPRHAGLARHTAPCCLDRPLPAAPADQHARHASRRGGRGRVRSDAGRRAPQRRGPAAKTCRQPGQGFPRLCVSDPDVAERC